MVNKFIDLEAQEDSSDEFGYDLEDVPDVGDWEEVGEQAISKRPRTDDQDRSITTHNSKQVAMENLIQDLAERYAGGNSHATQTSEQLIDSPVQAVIERNNTVDDWRLWRVKCTPGEEYSMLYQLMSKHVFLAKELRSAFFNPQNIGTIYLEAQFLPVGSLYRTLQTLSSVKIRTLVCVPQIEAVACLSISQDFNKPSAQGEWVTIKRGLYKGDVGVVVGSFERWGGARGSEVALVPRLFQSGSQKRKKPSSSSSILRPPPLLFDPANCVQDSLSKTDSGYKFKHWTFEDGLILKEYHSSNLAPARVVPSPLLPFFHQSKHPLIRLSTLPVPQHYCFEVGELVWVSAPNSDPIRGTILEIDGVSTKLDGSVVVDTDEGHQSFPPLYLSKAIEPGDFVEVLGGEFSGLTGFVVSRNETLLSIAPGRFGMDAASSSADFWVHINSVKLSTPPVAPVSTEPWINLEVVLKAGVYASLKATVKHVRPDGRGSLRVAVYVPSLFRTLDVDVFTIAEVRTGQLLFDFQPLQPYQHRFKAMPELKAMRTGRVPWVGMMVSIVHGEYKAQHGIVRDVNRYILNPKTPSKRSGLTLTLERLVMSGSTTSQLIKLDYEQVRYFKTNFKLAEIFWPSEQQSFYYPLTSLFDSLSTSTVYHTSTPPSNDETEDSGSQTPIPTEFEQVTIFTGVWAPGSPIASFNEEPWDETLIPGSQDNPPAIMSTSTSTSASVSTSLPSERDRGSSHWILNPKLFGIAIRVDIEGGPFDTIQKQKSQGAFVQTVLDSECITPMVVGARRSPIAVDKILKFRNRPKPTSERSLMVVIEGPHIGKFVRQVYHFFQGVKEDKNAKFIVMVMDRSTQVERPLDEILELDRNEVELVEERAHERRYMNGILKDIRDSWRVCAPEVRI
ncbi:hypothetical protein DFJ43DRAFT_1151198 [Lentinula guzmanii]|uniref:Chromatin elongation factor SPT5 n=1 Tax=Lentinula guzmanii TaxID=2804957 RepID=A0AA38JEF6_9AGAR|nr:hypothetical protein DFJ43DRAFT_1151198 [Lentinula guzmanii]